MTDRRQKKVPTTVYIDKETHDRFKSAVPSRKASDVIGRLIRDYLDPTTGAPPNERVQLEQAMGLLANAVTEQLLKNRDWAKETLVRAGMGLPGATVFDRRIMHFSWEKEETGVRLARWLLHRVSPSLKRGRRVVFVGDSGTTVFWFLKALGEAIRDCVIRLALNRTELGNLVVVTNNIPGAVSFVTYASHTPVSLDGQETNISDVVKCRLLPGTVLPRYAAVTGNDTNLDLDNFLRQVRADVSGRGKSSTRGGVSAEQPLCVGLTTGNWVLLPRGGGGVVVPRLLARGEGHREFKEKLLKVCHETFVLAPLGKVILTPQGKDPKHALKSFNEMLGFSSKRKEPEKKEYELVGDEPLASVKLVTTSRTEKSMLLQHSAVVRDALRTVSLLDPNDQNSLANAGAAITEVRHLVFPFDRDAGKSTSEQLLIELPHEETRTSEFMRQFLSVELQSTISANG